eukprot:jgi/Botrbrau1/9584/Bobra.106_2s0008.1
MRRLHPITNSELAPLVSSVRQGFEKQDHLMEALLLHVNQAIMPNGGTLCVRQMCKLLNGFRVRRPIFPYHARWWKWWKKRGLVARQGLACILATNSFPRAVTEG